MEASVADPDLVLLYPWNREIFVPELLKLASEP
jgi:hypothetical protein